MARKRRRRSSPSPMDAGQAAYLETAPVEPGDAFDEDAEEDMGYEDDAEPEDNQAIEDKIKPLDENEFQTRVANAVQAAET